MLCRTGPSAPSAILVSGAGFRGLWLFGDAIYWLLATKRTQAAAFSAWECISSAIGLVLNACTLGLLALGGSQVFGARNAMCTYPVWMALLNVMVCLISILIIFTPRS